MKIASCFTLLTTFLFYLNFLFLQAGHVCGDNLDLINGQPTGAIRVSFGYMSTLEDAQTCLRVLTDCFLENSIKPSFPASFSTLREHKVEQCNQSSLNVTKAEQSDTRNPHIISNVPDKRMSSKPSSAVEEDVHSCWDKQINVQRKATMKNSLVNDKDGLKRGNNNVVHLPTDAVFSEEYALADNVLTSNDVKLHEGRPFRPHQGRELTDILLYPVKSCAAFNVR